MLCFILYISVISIKISVLGSWNPVSNITACNMYIYVCSDIVLPITGNEHLCESIENAYFKKPCFNVQDLKKPVFYAYKYREKTENRSTIIDWDV